MDKEFYKNNYGVNIVKCCASCENKCFDKKGVRICSKGEGEVKPSSLCGEWKMSKSLSNAGKGGGFVKKLRYLHFVLNYEQPIEPQFHVPLKQIRAEYEFKYGTIYLSK